jgi:hypothetical protein
VNDRLLVHVSSSAALLGAFFAVLAFGQTTTHIMVAIVAGVIVGSVTESAVEIVLRQNRARRQFVLDALTEHGELSGLSLYALSSGLLPGTFYVLLDRMEEQGLIFSRLNEETGRRMYRIEAAGHSAGRPDVEEGR